MLGSGEFVMLLLVLFAADVVGVDAAAALLRLVVGRAPDRWRRPPRGGGNPTAIWRNVLLGCTECAVRALSKRCGGCVHSLYPVWAGSSSNCRHCEFEFESGQFIFCFFF